MNNAMIGWIVAVVVALGAGYYIFMMPKTAQAPGENFGTYSYQCDNGAKFTMTLSADLNEMTLKATTPAPFTDGVLMKVGNAQYAIEEGEVSFVGKGEGVTLTVGAATMHCTPVQDGNNAPFNWGN